MNKIACFLFFVFVFVGVAVAEPEMQYGNQATVAFGGENVDLESLASIKAASLSTREGDLALTAVYVLFKGDKDAVGFVVSVDCIEGDGLFYLSIVNASKSKKGDVREVIFPIKDLETVDGKRVVKIANPKKYMDKDGNIEVHISVVGGYITLNSVSVEFVKNKTEREFKKEEGLKKFTFFGIPPGVPEQLLLFHRGAVWLWDEGAKGFHSYDEWVDKIGYRPTTLQYIFYFNQEEGKK